MPSRKKNRPVRSVFLVAKRSLYQKFIVDDANASMKKFIKSKTPAARHIIKNHDEHQNALDSVKKILHTAKIPFDSGTRHDIESFSGYDLVLTVGGDGTFLRAGHYVDNQLIMGINSALNYSVGALCSATAHNFEKKLIDILSGKFTVRAWPRIQMAINGKKIPFEAINDFLFTNTCPASMSRYQIALNRLREEQKSSGVWISTATGSTAGINAAGGLKMHRKDQRVQFVVREPYQGIYNPYQLVRGFVNKGETLKFECQMTQAKIFIDGPTVSHDVTYGDKIAIKLAKKALHVIV